MLFSLEEGVGGSTWLRLAGFDVLVDRTHAWKGFHDFTGYDDMKAIEGKRDEQIDR